MWKQPTLKLRGWHGLSSELKQPVHVLDQNTYLKSALQNCAH